MRGWALSPVVALLTIPGFGKISANLNPLNKIVKFLIALKNPLYFQSFQIPPLGTEYKILGKPKSVTLPCAFCIQDLRARDLHRLC